jgi:hypothetical protein
VRVGNQARGVSLPKDREVINGRPREMVQKLGKEKTLIQSFPKKRRRRQCVQKNMDGS